MNKLLLKIFLLAKEKQGFPDSSVDRESACKTVEPGLIPGSGRSAEVIGYPLQYCWASQWLSW